MTKKDCFQTGVTAPASSDALFITLNRAEFNLDSERANFLNVISDLPKQLEQVRNHFSDANLHLTVGFSSDFWDFLKFESKPKDLKPFKKIVNDKVSMPATDADFLLHIRSDRHDVNYHLAQLLFDSLKPYLSLSELVRGFMYLDSRDLTGFVDGTENPQDEDRQRVAVVSDDLAFNGGSYIHLQKYLHDLDKWNSYSLKKQEDSYGRTKVDNVEYAATEKSDNAHTKRSSIKDSSGNSIEILRHSLPFGELDKSGLMFASYCAQAENFDLLLESMCRLDKNKETDHILNVTSAVTGDSFFAPSLDWFERQTIK